MTRHLLFLYLYMQTAMKPKQYPAEPAEQNGQRKMTTVKQIFEADQVLTLAIAKTLIGKKLAITNPEYRGNSASVRIITLTGIESEWDLAAKEPLEGYTSRQEYWGTILTDRAEEFKNRLKLVGAEGELPAYATCDLTDKWSFTESTFYGSDSDREIYYLIVE